nr:MAG TPA: hypothetical protein [Caudoviricetes sp.]
MRDSTVTSFRKAHKKDRLSSVFFIWRGLSGEV